MKLEGYISVKEYAEKNNVSVQSVYQKIWRGTINFIKVGTVTLIKES